MEVAKASIIKTLIIITSLLMLAFIPQINHAAQINHHLIEPINAEKYWKSWYYWHRWRESFSKGEKYFYFSKKNFQNMHYTK